MVCVKMAKVGVSMAISVRPAVTDAGCTVEQRQTAVAAHLKSEQLPLFAFARRCTHDTLRGGGRLPPPISTSQ